MSSELEREAIEALQEIGVALFGRDGNDVPGMWHANATWWQKAKHVLRKHQRLLDEAEGSE